MIDNFFICKNIKNFIIFEKIILLIFDEFRKFHKCINCLIKNKEK